MNRRGFLGAMVATAGGLLVPELALETNRVYSFPSGLITNYDLTGQFAIFAQLIEAANRCMLTVVLRQQLETPKAHPGGRLDGLVAGRSAGLDIVPSIETG